MSAIAVMTGLDRSQEGRHIRAPTNSGGDDLHGGTHGQVPKVPVKVWSWPVNGTGASAMTDAAGNYTISRVVPGTTRVSAEDSTGDRTYATEYAQPDGTSAAVEASIPVSAGPTITTANFALDRNVGVVAVATDVNGKPLPDLELDPYTKNADGSWSFVGGELTTDSQGRAFPNAAIGDTLYLCMTDDRYNVDYPGGTPHPTRYTDTCFGGATREAATPVTVTEANRHPKVTIPMAVAGSGLQPQAPFVLGTHVVGNTLTVDTGVWAPADTSVSIQWYRGAWGEEAGGPIAGATGASYTVPAEFDGVNIHVAVTGTRTGYKTATLRSEPYRIGDDTPTASPQTAIVGSAVQGQTLRAQDGTFTPAGEGSWTTHRWYVGGKLVAVGDSLTLTAGHVGQKVSLRTEYQPPYSSQGNDLHMMTTTGVVQGLLTAATPTITGTTAKGYALTANAGAWGPAPVTLAYQWFRSGTAISGATAATYTLTSYDVGKAMTVQVTGSKAGYVTAAKTSAATAAVLNTYATAPAPTISGTKKVGYTLTANVGTWSPTPSSFKYQWFRGTTAISGAVYRTYKLTSYDKGKVVKVRVTPVRTGYYNPGKYSAGYTIG